jgi:hypothetical protein
VFGYHAASAGLFQSFQLPDIVGQGRAGYQHGVLKDHTGKFYTKISHRYVTLSVFAILTLLRTKPPAGSDPWRQNPLNPGKKHLPVLFDHNLREDDWLSS